MQGFGGGGLVVKKVNFPNPGGVMKIDGLMQGGNSFSLVKDKDGKTQIVDVMMLAFDEVPGIVHGKAGSILMPHDLSNSGEFPSIFSGYMIGPPVATIPKMTEPEVTDQSCTQKKKPAMSVKEVVMNIGEEEVNMILSKHISRNVMKMPVAHVIQVGADDELQILPDGKADLMKVLMCEGVELSLMLAKSYIPKSANRVHFVLLASSPQFNDGDPVHLLSSMPQSGAPSDLLKPGLLGQTYGVKDIWNVSWGFDREVVEGMLKPIIKFARDLDQLITSSKWQKSINSFDPEMRGVAKKLQKLYQKRKGEEFSELLSYVKTCMTYENGVATPSGILLANPGVEGEVESELEDDDSDDDPEYNNGNSGKKGSVFSRSGPRSKNRSPAKRSAHSSPGSSSKSAKSKRSAVDDSECGIVRSDEEDSDDEELYAADNGSCSGM